MNREYAKRERREIVKLVIISILVVLAYLAVSFKEVYGFDITGFFNFNYDNNQAIEWRSDKWMQDPSDDTFAAFNYTNRFTGWPSTNTADYNQNYDFDSDMTNPEKVPTIPEPGVLLLVGIGLTGIQITRKLFR